MELTIVAELNWILLLLIIIIAIIIKEKKQTTRLLALFSQRSAVLNRKERNKNIQPGLQNHLSVIISLVPGQEFVCTEILS